MLNQTNGTDVLRFSSESLLFQSQKRPDPQGPSKRQREKQPSPGAETGNVFKRVSFKKETR